jgi:hypothetical protein
LAEHRDVAWIAAETVNVVLHPPQRSELVEESAVIRCAVDVREALEPGPVIRANHDRAGCGHR